METREVTEEDLIKVGVFGFGLHAQKKVDLFTLSLLST
jgi:hypothetical protein